MALATTVPCARVLRRHGYGVMRDVTGATGSKIAMPPALARSAIDLKGIAANAEARRMMMFVTLRNAVRS